jgi:hypothetical protein
MIKQACCIPHSRAVARMNESGSPGFASVARSRSLAGAMIPSALLAVLPKCPACLAAYISLASGVGISMSAAARLRTMLVAGSVGAIGYLVAKFMKQAWRLT